jgi:tRNA dimethylallyltransferase
LNPVDDQNGRPFGVLIAGPTASGKSALGLALAERLDAEIVNADSMQVYEDLAIVTARPASADEAAVPHNLYGHVSGAEVFSTGQWLKDAVSTIDEVCARGHVPIVLGGTGLYFRALTEGFVEVPAIPAEIRKSTRAEVDEIGSVAAHKLIAEVDPVWAAKVHENDPQRIARGLEVFRATGQALTSWHDKPVEPPLSIPMVKAVLEPDRGWLRNRIDQRFAMMVESGALDEVAELLSKGYSPSLPVMKALGVPELAQHLRGDMSLDDACALASIKSRQYAKRQSTWFRQQMIAWNSVIAQDLERQIDEIFSFIDDSGLTLRS